MAFNCIAKKQKYPASFTWTYRRRHFPCFLDQSLAYDRTRRLIFGRGRNQLKEILLPSEASNPKSNSKAALVGTRLVVQVQSYDFKKQKKVNFGLLKNVTISPYNNPILERVFMCAKMCVEKKSAREISTDRLFLLIKRGVYAPNSGGVAHKKNYEQWTLGGGNPKSNLRQMISTATLVAESLTNFHL